MQFESDVGSASGRGCVDHWRFLSVEVDDVG